MPMKDESGKRYGKLLVTDKFESVPYKGVYYIKYLCICDCGIEKWIKACNLRAGRAMSCGCGRKDNPNFGFSRISKDSKYFFKSWLSFWRAKAKRDELSFDLTMEDLDNLYDKQEGKCFYTGDTFILAANAKFCIKETNISIDRIDITKGYSIDNVVFCLKMVNISRNVYTQQEFITMCRRVANNPLLTEESLENLPNRWYNKTTREMESNTPIQLTSERYSD